MKIIMLMLVIGLSACGYSSRNNETIGQVKKVIHNTPIFCYDYDDVDVSLGVMRNGVGSVSTQDKWFYVPNKDDLKILKDANETGAIVKILFDQPRFMWCPDYVSTVTHVEIVK